MIAEENILKFLRRFNKDSKVDSRVLKMLTSSSSCECDILDMARDLIKSSVNVENLQPVLSQYKEQSGRDTGVFDDRDRLRSKFKLFSASNAADNDAAEKFANRSDRSSNEEVAKRPKIEPQRNVNKYSEEHTDGVVDSLKESLRECFIPGLEGTVSEEDSSDRLLREPENEDVSHDLGKQQVRSVSKPRTRSAGRAHKASEQSLDGKGHGGGCGKDSVFSQNILPGGGMAPHKLKDPSYLYPVLQCKLCGLRFAKDSTEQFGLHIEDHRRKTKALGDKMVLRREFFSSKSVSRMEKLDLEIEGGAEAIVWKKEPPYCAICSKIIKKAWSDDVEDWILDSGTRINDKEFAHRECVL